jgi:hypothetical protein
MMFTPIVICALCRIANFLPKLSSEDNVPALDKALDAILVFLAHCPPHIFLPFVDGIVTGIVHKAFVAKPTVQEKGVRVLSIIFATGGHDQVVVRSFLPLPPLSFTQNTQLQTVHTQLTYPIRLPDQLGCHDCILFQQACESCYAVCCNSSWVD